MENTNTTSHEAEIKNCADNFIFFCENYVKVVHPLRGLVPFTLHDYQKRYANALGSHRFLATVKFRQGGFTTVTLAWLLWRLLFKIDESNMVMSRTDREAISCNKIMRNMIDQLPDFLKPTFSKYNDHNIHYDNLGNKLYFHTPEAACGRALNYLFLDEAAFIKDMDAHWKAMYPTLSTGGHCIAASTPNGTKNWFHQIVKDAWEHKNEFFVFTAEYHEHPDYDNPTWVANTKNNLGQRGWRQEVLCEFLDPMTINDRFERGTDFLCEITATEEVAFLADRKKKFNSDHGSLDKFVQQKKAENRGKKNQTGFEVFHNHHPRKLVFEDCDFGSDNPEMEDECEKNFMDWVYKDTDTKEFRETKEGDKVAIKSTYKPDVIQFENLTKDEIHAKFNKDHDGFDPSTVKHPEIADPKEFDTAESLVELWAALGYPEWEKILQRRRREERRREDRINRDFNDVEAMVLCGLITKAEAAEMMSTRPDLSILGRLTGEGDLPDNMNIEFFDGFLCINEVPTVIKEDDIRDAYNGHLALTSEQEAIDIVVNLLKSKIMPLFGIPKEAKCPTNLS